MKEISFLLILLTFISCNQNHERSNESSQIDNSAIEYNNKGFKLAQFSESKDTLKLALSYFDKALEIDSTYKNALGNKVGILLRLDELDKALEVHSRLYEISPGENALLQGMIVEKVHNFKKAEPYYSESVRYFSTRFDTTTNIDSKIGFGINKVYSLYLARKDGRANQVYDSLLTEFSDKEILRFHPELSKADFNRLEFMDTFFSH